ncbi:MAG: RNA polymerase sigma factor [Isosphaeraceae bacterium]
MKPTSISLLDRLRMARPDASDWERLQGIYRPLIRAWIARVPGVGSEADDLAQDILAIVCRAIPTFDRRREGSFRAWLRQVTTNQIRAEWRNRRRRPAVAMDATDGFLDRLADPGSDLARDWDREHDQFVIDRLLATVRPDFESKTWEAFRKFALEGTPAKRVADELGMTENAVLQAKSRILRRMRQEAGDLLG